MNAFTKFNSQTISADYTLEVEVTLSGTFSPGYAGDRTDPPEADGVEDVEVEGLGALRFVRRNATSTWDTVDLLAGVDRNSDAWRQISANVLAAIGLDTAAETLLGEVQ